MEQTNPVTAIRSYCLFLLLLFLSGCSDAQPGKSALLLYHADDARIRYTGRVDFSDPQHPRFWQPGVYIEWMFEGSDCELILEDEMLWGNSHNYIGLIVDGKETRLQTKTRLDTISVAKYLSPGQHKVTLVKNTEAGIGYLSVAGIRCEKLLDLPSPPVTRIEFIGNSITCGMGSDQREVACDKGVWYDQHNAYSSYGAITARALNAQYHLSAVSGIGLMHSCCGMKIIMPQVFDKINMREDTISWDFKRYQPDIVTVCLGQNDGIQDSIQFGNNYIRFLQKIRGYYPHAKIVCLSSPMADDKLIVVMKRYITGIVREMNRTDPEIFSFFFSRRYSSGCGQHPSLEEHEQIALELTGFLKKMLK